MMKAADLAKVKAKANTMKRLSTLTSLHLNKIDMSEAPQETQKPRGSILNMNFMFDKLK